MRVKTSVSLPKELLSRLDRLDKNRSAILERAAVAYLARLERHARDQKDLEIIDRNAERLNREALDTLKFQQILRNAASSIWCANRAPEIRGSSAFSS